MQALLNPAQRLEPLPQRLYVVAFSAWKRPFLKLCFPGVKLMFVGNLSVVPAAEAAVVWGLRDEAALGSRRAPVFHVEDGFLRSVGLGADLVRPVSWVVDRRGIYFNPRQASDLEAILSAIEIDADLATRAARLRERIVSEGLTKYNVGAAAWLRPQVSRKVILVPGQVETDASIVFGAPGVRTNIDLLKAVRQTDPDAYVVYKPHPDVVARLRVEGAGEQGAHRWCDEIVVDARMADLLDAVDEVQVMTSLAGFEALLRGKRVVCHGQPFYSGWGLTIDRVPAPARSRKLALDELIAGALIAYPFYFSRDGKRLLTPEQAIDALVRWRDASGGLGSWWRSLFRIVLRQVVGVR